MKYTYNLFNPLDYLRLLYVVFFNMTDTPGTEQRREQLMLIGQSIITLIGINLATGMLTDWGGDWKVFVLGVAGGVAGGVVFGVAGGVADRMAGGVAVGVAVGVAGGVTVGVAGGVAGSMAGGVAVGVAVGVAFGVAFGVAGGVAGGVVFGVMFGVAVGVAVGVTESWGMLAGLGIALVGGVLALVIAAIFVYIIAQFWNNWVKPRSAAADLWNGLVLLLLLCVAAGYFYSLLSRWLPAFGDLHPLWITTIFLLAFSRLPLYPLELLICRVGSLFRLPSRRTIEQLLSFLDSWYFDRHLWLPLPGEARVLQKIAELDWRRGIEETVKIARYSDHLLQAVKALRCFARIDPYGIQGYLRNVSDENDRRRFLQYTFYQQPESVSWARAAYQGLFAISAQLVPKQETTEKTDSVFAHLRDLLEIEKTKTPNLDIDSVITELCRAVEEMQFANRLAGEKPLRYGEDMAALYNGFKTALEWSNIGQIAHFLAPVLPATDAPLLFSSNLIEILTEMERFAQSIHAYNQATSQVTRQRVLLEANEKIVNLGEQVEEVPPPAGPIMALVIARWQRLLATAGGEAARAQEVKPVDNPYVIANPVIGGLFVGREDIMKRLEEVWVGEGQKPSIVLYGHRRMGKSSILDNLGARFGAQTIIVDFNMQREGMVESSGELLYNLALAIYDVLPTPNPSQEGNAGKMPALPGIAEPEEEQFTVHNPYTAFNRFLKRLDQVRGENRFIITVDEFELVEELIEKGVIEARLLDFWRSLIQTYPWFVLALAGLHTLQEMTEDYWHPLFASVIGIQVSFLRPAAARKLITQPTPDFPIDYDQDAIETIINLTNGQPYLAQLICHGLVTRFNRQRFEEGVERERRFSLEDVEAVINAPEFFRDGNAYFTGVWVQAEKSEPAGQTQALRTLAESERAKPAEDIAHQAELTLEEVHAALETLARHDVVKKLDDRWHFTVELMRRWVAKKKE